MKIINDSLQLLNKLDPQNYTSGPRQSGPSHLGKTEPQSRVNNRPNDLDHNPNVLENSPSVLDRSVASIDNQDDLSVD